MRFGSLTPSTEVKKPKTTVFVKGALHLSEGGHGFFG